MNCVRRWHAHPPGINPINIRSKRHIALQFPLADVEDHLLSAGRKGIRNDRQLIGLQSPWRDPMERLFRDIQWSQPDVLEVTCRRAQKSGLTVSLLSVREDIDTVDELATLRQTLGLESSQADVALGRLRDEIERIMSPETHPTPSFPPHSATNK